MNDEPGGTQESYKRVMAFFFGGRPPGLRQQILPFRWARLLIVRTDAAVGNCWTNRLAERVTTCCIAHQTRDGSRFSVADHFATVWQQNYSELWQQRFLGRQSFPAPGGFWHTCSLVSN